MSKESRKPSPMAAAAKAITENVKSARKDVSKAAKLLRAVTLSQNFAKRGKYSQTLPALLTECADFVAEVYPGRESEVKAAAVDCLTGTIPSRKVRGLLRDVAAKCGGKAGQHIRNANRASVKRDDVAEGKTAKKTETQVETPSVSAPEVKKVA